MLHTRMVVEPNLDGHDAMSATGIEFSAVEQRAVMPPGSWLACSSAIFPPRALPERARHLYIQHT